MGDNLYGSFYVYPATAVALVCGSKIEAKLCVNIWLGELKDLIRIQWNLANSKFKAVPNFRGCKKNIKEAMTLKSKGIVTFRTYIIISSSS